MSDGGFSSNLLGPEFKLWKLRSESPPLTSIFGGPPGSIPAPWD